MVFEDQEHSVNLRVETRVRDNHENEKMELDKYSQIIARCRMFNISFEQEAKAENKTRVVMGKSL